MNKIKITLIIMCAFFIVFSSINITTAFKNDTVLYYDGKAKSFEYFNLDKKNLFHEFKELMPGDVKVEKLQINTININEKTDFYLKLDLNEKILNKINLKMFKNDVLIYNSQTDTLDNELIKLYTFEKNDNISLTLNLEVPEEIGNELSDINSKLELTFIAETKNEQIEVPNTFDDSKIIMQFVILLTSLLMMLIILLTLKKENSKKNTDLI